MIRRLKTALPQHGSGIDSIECKRKYYLYLIYMKYLYIRNITYILPIYGEDKLLRLLE